MVAIGSGSTPERLKLAEEFGAQKVFDYRASTVEDRHEYVLELAKKYGRADGADVVIEASGSPKAFPEGLGLVRTRGRYLVPGQYSDSGEVSIPPHLITLRALRVIGSGQYTLDDVKSYLDFLAANEDVQVLFANTISDRFAVADANTAIARVSNGECVKAVFSS